MRQLSLERWLGVAGNAPRRLGQRLRCAQARDHVFTLRVQQELAEEFVGASGWVAREHNAGGAVVAAIAEHHGLDRDGGTPSVGNIVEAPIGDGARVLPRTEHGGDGAPKLLMQILRERPLLLGLDQRLEAGDDLGPVLGLKLRVKLEAFERLVVL